MAKAEWGSDWKVGVRVWVEREGQAVLGEGRAELLAAIVREHSITKAAKAAGMSYRRAWNLIQEVNAAAGETLVEAAVGGKQGGGARLTPNGLLALEVYDRVRQSLVESTAGALQQSLAATEKAGGPIHLAAAISLQEAVGQVLAEFALRQPTIRVRTIFGASNELADHLLAGAPGDLFITAEPSELDRLAAAKLVQKSSCKTVAANGLAIVGSKKSKPIKKPTDLLGTSFKRVALAEPACPLGQYSQAYLAASRVDEKLQAKVLWVDNSRAVLAAVASGAAQAGVAFSSDAAGTGGWQLLLSVPSSKASTKYASAILARSAKRSDVVALNDFLTSSTAARCYRRCGLRPAAI